MKWTSTFVIAILAMLAIACSNDKTPQRPGQVIPPTNQPMPATNNNPAADIPPAQATNALGVFHYICPNGDPGGSGSAGACATCGATLVHNQAFHDNANTDINSPEINIQQPQIDQPANAAQNAAGEYHYTCPNGHPGSGSAGACATCGATLAHNQAFHSTGASTTTAPSVNSSSNGPISPIIQQPGQQPMINVPTSPKTATNATGQYHYICSNGCSGGAGASGTCASCGAQLVHNQAYHN